eukprot:gnl/TRDRNA2_/TRDRNA2_204491_c0_seq1.p1 gnl/TRDRNA2_/TRDRNA2_204491_c0~~gnl/TRDRNA2_/TRDRNA2_204491_c0_seq1.p1  ORF type:complete len:190 (+),score=28.87 gnl/TRDRNA2_/TRDRNA2_204491_c0_seq1:100-669(+)
MLEPSGALAEPLLLPSSAPLRCVTTVVMLVSSISGLAFILNSMPHNSSLDRQISGEPLITVTESTDPFDNPRVDKNDGEAYTDFDCYALSHKGTMSEEEMKKYWLGECTPLVTKGKCGDLKGTLSKWNFGMGVGSVQPKDGGEELVLRFGSIRTGEASIVIGNEVTFDHFESKNGKKEAINVRIYKKER